MPSDSFAHAHFSRLAYERSIQQGGAMRCDLCGLRGSAKNPIIREPFLGWFCIPCAEELEQRSRRRCSASFPTADSGPFTRTENCSASASTRKARAR